MRKYINLLILLVAATLSCMAQKNIRLTNLSIEENNTIQDSVPENYGSTQNAFLGYVFVGMPTYLAYNFKQETILYTPAFMGGGGVRYKTVAFEMSALVNKNDVAGLSFDLIYGFKVKSLDEKWKSSNGIVGEAAYFPAQQSNPKMWMYTIGFGHQIFCPMKWGTPAFGFFLGITSLNEELHLNARMMINLSVPIF